MNWIEDRRAMRSPRVAYYGEDNKLVLVHEFLGTAYDVRAVIEFENGTLDWALTDELKMLDAKQLAELNKG